jgi:hypothetical protein
MFRITVIALALVLGLDHFMMGGKYTAAGKQIVTSILRHAR